MLVPSCNETPPPIGGVLAPGIIDVEEEDAPPIRSGKDDLPIAGAVLVPSRSEASPPIGGVLAPTATYAEGGAPSEATEEDLDTGAAKADGSSAATEADLERPPDATDVIGDSMRLAGMNAAGIPCP